MRRLSLSEAVSRNSSTVGFWTGTSSRASGAMRQISASSLKEKVAERANPQLTLSLRQTEPTSGHLRFASPLASVGGALSGVCSTLATGELYPANGGTAARNGG